MTTLEQFQLWLPLTVVYSVLRQSVSIPCPCLCLQAAASDDEEDGPYTAADLEGLKMKTDVTELADGETVIVTLADRGILDEHGNLRQDEEDELEDVLVAEQRKRDKAMKAAGKAKPLWEEDGKVRAVLSAVQRPQGTLLDARPFQLWAWHSSLFLATCPSACPFRVLVCLSLSA